jgi:hypothetical protein
MSIRFTIVALSVLLLSTAALPQQPVRYKAAIVALTDDPDLRMHFEDTLAAKAIEHNYDAVTSYGMVPEVRDLDEDRFLDVLASQGVQTVLMLRPAAIGRGSSLESVRKEVSPRLYRDMQRFARQVSSSGTEDLIAVVHMAIYMLDGNEPDLISSGAVWLDEDVDGQEEGIERLQDLIVRNVDAVRPAIREHLGLPPL